MTLTARSMIKPFAATLMAATTLVPATVLAGTALLADPSGHQISYEYNGTSMRMGSPGEPSYSVVLDGTMYVVNMEDGEPMVINASSMMQGLMGGMAQGMVENMNQDQLAGEVISIDETNRKETVAGIQGDVYEVRLRDNNGKERVEEAVFSEDARAREFTAALFQMVQVAAIMAGEETASEANEMYEMLDAMEVGILRVGKDMTVTELTDDVVPAERFALPAEPMDFGGLGNIFGGGQQSGDKSDSEDAGLGGVLKKLFDND